MTFETFSWDWAPERPVRWDAGEGASVRYLSLDDAAARLTRYGVAGARERLEAGETISTFMADYSVVPDPAPAIVEVAA